MYSVHVSLTYTNSTVNIKICMHYFTFDVHPTLLLL